MSEAEVGGMEVEAEPSTSISSHFVAMQQMVAERYSDKMVSDMEVCTKWRCVADFLHEEKIKPTCIHWHLLNIHGDQTGDVSTLRQWVMHLSNDAIIAAVKQRITFMDADFHRLLFIAGKMHS